MQIYTKNQVNEISLALREGKAVILPTDTVWGIVSLNEGQIYTIKKRPLEKKVSKFVDSVEGISLPSFFANVIKEYWPGQLTVIWNDIAYRMPNCKYLLELIKLTGPLYQSSANISGKQPIEFSQQAFTEFKNHLNNIVMVDNAPYEQFSKQPSTIIDLNSLTVIRPGPVDGNEVIRKIKERKPK